MVEIDSVCVRERERECVCEREREEEEVIKKNGGFFSLRILGNEEPEGVRSKRVVVVVLGQVQHRLVRV